MPLELDDLDDGALWNVVRHVTQLRAARATALTSKRWLALCKLEWLDRGELCAGLDWKPSLACEVERFDSTLKDGDSHEDDDDWRAHKERVCQLPFVMGFVPAPSAAMWALTTPTARGGEQVYFDSDGFKISGMWGCNQSVGYDGDSGWNRGFVWGVMAFQPDAEKEVGFYVVKDRPEDALDPTAVVAQYPVSVHVLDMTFLGHHAALYNSGLGGEPDGYCIGGRLLRMANGSSEESVMASLGFTLNPAVDAEDVANELRWCRLPDVDHFKDDQYFGVIVVPISYGDTDEDSDEEDSDDDKPEGEETSDEQRVIGQAD